VVSHGACLWHVPHPLLRLLQEWLLRARSRREIAKLDRHTIGDLGLTPSQMQFEAQKPFWRR
jgi:uncharacterized protein YjiS (DUF1127 family)